MFLRQHSFYRASGGCVASSASASRTGVRLTPRRSETAASDSIWKGFSSKVRIWRCNSSKTCRASGRGHHRDDREDQQADQQTDLPQVARTVTVEVTPEQSQTLALAQKAGTLSLSLRSLDNAEDKPLESIRLSDILREQSPVEEPTVAKPTVRVRRANAVEVVEVE